MRGGSIRKKMQARDVFARIPMRKSRKIRVGVDHAPYSLRNPVERCFNKLKNARRVAPPLRQNRRQLPWFHRHHVHPPVAPPFVNTA